MRGWFGRTKKVAVKDEDEEERTSGGLGGFGALQSFSMESVLPAGSSAADPRAPAKQQQEEAPPSPEQLPPKKASPPPKNAPVVSDNSSDNSSSSSSEESDDDDEYGDDYSIDQSTVAGPLFDESAYSVNEDEYSVDTFDVSQQEGEWRQKKANDFLADFYAKQEDKA